ncbi:phosphate ABC transporter substrate-binding protein PstS [Allobranchiibius sp. GilTou73]|uniref:phosphate ABC transporter substrate-binding protein PstS n=1 Tax=Allobranchiibius sp. GilTou73 TaxID=2904523 RepID=UPI001F366973|nr:phosphate ABC transporter substrate-binding protein PstS [Allobranchiibius sp. GilTou73]UIJ35948.1 phosphate ABC transporter substrate-binding protein PstS [Allobranchiibius sp. GilTou73]
MKITSIGRASGVAVAAALALTACGSASNNGSTGSGSGSSSSSSVAAGTKTADSSCFSGSLSGQGSTAQGNAMQLATTDFASKCSGAKVNYAPTSSGQGITAFLAKQVGWAGSDSALNSEKGEPTKAAAACGSTAWDLPMVVGPIAVAYNLKGVGKLTLTPVLIAKIFSGKITKWNDSAIAAANKGVSLPSTPISVFFRSDSSGTTDNFTNYMNTTDPTDWTAKHAKAWAGKVGQGKPKSAGVGSAVKATDGGITYVEWSYAITNNLPMAQVDNGGGAVALTAATASKAAEAATIAGTGNDLKLKIDYATKAAGTYPIVLVTYEIVCSKYADATTGKAVKSFLSYLVSPEFQGKLSTVGSAPLPSAIQGKVVTAINAIG